MIGNEDDKIMKISFYFEKGQFVHVSCKTVNVLKDRFYNGTITEVNSEKEFMVLKDRKLGEIPIMFEEIFDIVPFTDGGVKC